MRGSAGRPWRPPPRARDGAECGRPMRPPPRARRPVGPGREFGRLLATRVGRARASPIRSDVRTPPRTPISPSAPPRPPPPQSATRPGPGRRRAAASPSGAPPVYPFWIIPPENQPHRFGPLPPSQRRFGDGPDPPGAPPSLSRPTSRFFDLAIFRAPGVSPNRGPKRRRAGRSVGSDLGFAGRAGAGRSEGEGERGESFSISRFSQSVESPLSRLACPQFERVWLCRLARARWVAGRRRIQREGRMPATPWLVGYQHIGSEIIF